MIKKKQIGNTTLKVTELSMGTAPISGWPNKTINSNEAYKTFDAAWNKGIRFFDTAPAYGSGLSEERLGLFLKEKKREDFCVSTKVGRLVVEKKSESINFFKSQDPNKDTIIDFSYDGVMRSFEESLNRLQIDSIDILHLHDPDTHPDNINVAKNGAIKAMINLKEQNVVKAIGCGMNQNEMLVDLAKLDCFDCFLLAGRYTLLDQTSFNNLIPICEEKNISLLLGGIFNSGILINPNPSNYLDYIKLDKNWSKNAINSLKRPVKNYESSEYWLSKAYKIQEICNEFNISLKHAAIQFSFLNKSITTSILGMSHSQEVDENFKAYKNKISDSFWKKIKEKGLIDKRSPV